MSNLNPNIRDSRKKIRIRIESEYIRSPLFENKHWVLKVFESQMKRISIYKCQSQKNLVGWHIHPDLRLLDWIIYLPHRTAASRLELIYWNLSLNWAKSNFQHFSDSNKVFSIHLWFGSRLCSLGELSTVFTM